MPDNVEPREQLLSELERLRRRNAELEAAVSQVERRPQHVTLLTRITTLIASATDMTDALQHVCSELARYLGVPQAGFAILDPQRSGAEVIADYHPPDSPSAMGATLPVHGNPSMEYILKHRTALVVEDAQTDPLLAPVRNLMRQRNVLSILIVPIIARGEVVGTLGFDAFEKRVFEEADIRLVQHVANQAGQLLLSKQSEAALRESQRLLQSTFDAIQDGISILSPELTIIRVNRSMKRWYPHALPLEGKKCYLAYHGRTAPCDPCPTFRTLQQGTPQHNLVPLTGPEGTSGWLDLYTFPIKDASGAVTGVVEYVRDATVRRQAEEEVKRRTNQLEALRQLGLEIAAQLDLDTLLHSIVSRAMQLLDSSSGGLYLYRPEQDMLQWVVAIGPDLVPPGIVLRRGEGLSGKVWETGEPLIVDDYGRWEGRAAIYDGYPFTAVLGVPVRWGDEFLGVLDVMRDAPRTFSQPDAELLSLFATQAAIAVKNAQLLQTQREQWELAEALATAAAIVNSSLETEAVLDRILEQVERVVPGDTFNVMLIEGDRASIVRSRGYQRVGIQGPSPAQAISVDQYPSLLKMLQTGEPVTIPDTAASPEWVQRDNREWRRSYVGAPISVENRTVGFLNVNGTRPGQFSPADAQRLSAFANYAATAIDNARLYRDAQQRVAELEMLRHTSLQLTSSLDLSTVLNAIAESALALVEATDCHIYLYDELNDTFSFGTALWENGRREPAVKMPRRDGLTATVVREGQPIIIEDAPRHPLFASAEARGWQVQAVAGFPLKRAGRIVGVFTIAFVRPHAFTTDELRVLGLLADQAAIAIENARLVEGLEEEVAIRTGEIRAEQEKSEAILRSVGEAIALIDLDLRIQYVNEAYTALTGYTTQDVRDRDPATVGPVVESEQIRESLRKTVAGGIIWRGETVARRKDGRTYDAMLTVAPVQDGEGRVTGYVASHQDISLQKELERARRQFMTNVSHELRTPVANIKLYTELLQRGTAGDKTERYLSVLGEQADRLSQLVQGILEMITLDSGQAARSWTTVALSTLVQDTATRFQDRAQAAGLSLVLKPLPPDLPAVSGDQVRLGQALGELVKNAVTFTPLGGQVTIRAGRVEQDGRTWVTISVQDTGPGIPAEEQPRVFDRFFRGLLTESGHIPGTGLGLSMAQEILRAHGGRVTVDSVPGQGSTFTLWLPAAA
jgi:PAS domain S-box-containing protein